MTIIFTSTLLVVAVEALEQAETTTISVEFTTSIILADGLISVRSTLHEAAVIVSIPDAHGISRAISLITFIFTLAAALGGRRIPHAAVITVTSSSVRSDELTLDTALEGTNRPVTHELTTTRVRVFKSVASSTAFIGDLIPHAALVVVTGVNITSIRVVGFTSRTAAERRVGFSGVPFAHGVGETTLFVTVVSISRTAVSTLTSSRLPLTSSISTTSFSFLVLVDTASEAVLLDLVEAAHGGS